MRGYPRNGNYSRYNPRRFIFHTYNGGRNKFYVGDDGVEAVETLKHSISRVVRLDLDGIPNHRRRSCMKDFERIAAKGFLSMSNEI